jgi:superfamily I DNA/RNA helicase
MANPKNDTLRWLYLVALGDSKGFQHQRSIEHADRMVKDPGMMKMFDSTQPHLPRDVSIILSSVETFSRESRALIAERARELPQDATMTDLALALAQRDEPPPAPTGIQVMTVHAAKGREFDAVFLIGLEQETWPGKRPEELEEERRLAYVAVTRARQRLYLYRSASRTVKYPNGFEETKPRSTSQFIAEILGSAA